ncbi:MAG: hypothetical protein MUF40_02130 [Gemmatimonadaceae bacterium]|nr:hypothetical protein [Gemmatimonadaceae bacterium]
MRAQLPAGPDSLLRARADSIAREDSVKRPLPTAELPARVEGAFSYRFRGDSLHVNGALTLADLLERVPGLTTFRARFYTAPMVGAVAGDVGRLRLFLDGVELEAFDPRSGGIPDLSLFPVATLEEVAVERAADEVRVHMRSWRGPLVRTAASRLDVLTGDDRANTFRGYVARRWKPGWAVQFMLQQRSLQESPVIAGDGDALAAFARLGYVGRWWSADATLNRRRNTRVTLRTLSIVGEAPGRSIPGMELTEQDVTLRVAAGRQERGPWLQALLANRSMLETSPARTAAGTPPNNGIRPDTADTTFTRRQYVLAAGWTAGALRLSATHRLRDMEDGRRLQQPSVRAALETSRATVAFFGERSPFDETTRLEVHGRLQPLSWFLVQGTASTTSAGTAVAIADTLGGLGAFDAPRGRAVRLEAGLKLGRLWVTGGVLTRDSAVLRPPLIFDQTYPTVVDGGGSALVGTIVGPIGRGFSTHVHAVQWDEAGLYRPRRQARAELFFRTDWRRRFPSGNFALGLGGIVEYRDRVLFPRPDGSTITATSAGTVGAVLELRLKDATISWRGTHDREHDRLRRGGRAGGGAPHRGRGAERQPSLLHTVAQAAVGVGAPRAGAARGDAPARAARPRHAQRAARARRGERGTAHRRGPAQGVRRPAPDRRGRARAPRRPRPGGAAAPPRCPRHRRRRWRRSGPRRCCRSWWRRSTA